QIVAVIDGPNVVAREPLEARRGGSDIRRVQEREINVQRNTSGATSNRAAQRGIGPYTLHRSRHIGWIALARGEHGWPGLSRRAAGAGRECEQERDGDNQPHRSDPILTMRLRATRVPKLANVDPERCHSTRK